MNRKITLFVFAVFCFLSQGYAQWAQLDGLYGGRTNDLKVHKNNLYVATDGGLYKSSDGNFYNLVTAPFMRANVYSLAEKDSNLYVGTLNGLYKTSDAGINWVKIDHGNSQYPIVGQVLFFKDKICIKIGNSIYGGYQPSCDYYTWSTDNGLTWSQPVINSISSMFSDGNNLYFIYLDYQSYQKTYLFKSNDGINWITDTIDKSKSVVQHSMLYNSKSKRLFASGFDDSKGGFLYTKDSVNNWVLQPFNQNIQSFYQHGDTLFAGTEDAVYFSINNDSYWSLMGNKIDAMSITSLTYFNGTFYSGGVNFSRAYTGGFAGGFYKFNRIKNSWEPSGKGILAASLFDVVCYKNKITGTYYHGTVGCKDFKYFAKLNNDWSGGLGILGDSLINFNCDSLNRYYKFNKLNVFDSTSNKWKPLNNNLPNYGGDCFLIDNKIIYFTSGTKFYKSSDKGKTFVFQNPSFSINESTYDLVKSANVLYMLTNSKIYVSSDEGKNWVGYPISSYLYNNMHLAEHNGVLFLCGNAGKSFAATGVLTSINGANWMEVNKGLPSKDIYSLYGHNNIIYAGLNGSVYYSLNYGTSWNLLSTGFPNVPVNKLFVNGLYLYASTKNAGIWRCNIDGLELKNNKTITGRVFQNLNSTCIAGTQKGVPNYLVKAEPGPYYAITDSIGQYTLNVDTGNYTIGLITPAQLRRVSNTVCPFSNTYSVKTDSTHKTDSNINFGVEIKYCPFLQLSISNSRLRRCFKGNTDISYKNSGIQTANGVYVKITFPDYVLPLNSKPAWSSKEGNVLTFDIGSLADGASGSISITDSIICGNEAIRGLTQCMKAQIYPSNACSTPSPEWDKSNVYVNGTCENGTTKMVIKNKGTGNMALNSEYRVFFDNVLVKKNQFKLNAGDSVLLSIVSNGKTVRVEADQHPKHPGYSRPRATDEGCVVPSSVVISKGFFLQALLDNGNADEQMVCSVIRDSFDPNEKVVIPSGIAAANYTLTNSELEYTIHFQNTGTDTAYNIVLIDTLSSFLDVNTFSSDISSHPYTVMFQGKGQAIKWTFKNIYLPNTSSNEKASHGFVKYKIKEKPGNSKGTVISNKAYIFFDYNSAIITNETMNTMYDTTFIDFKQGTGITSIVSSVNSSVKGVYLNIYPNPARDKLYIDTTIPDLNISIFTTTGQKVLDQPVILNHSGINIQHLQSGIYFYKIEGKAGNKIGKLVIER
jgi:uncharacterized repeat protein (TIGR01451 family)